MVKSSLDGGGNAMQDGAVVVRRSAAIGDAIAATVVSDRLIELGFHVVFQTHVNIHCALRRHTKLAGVTEPNGFSHVDLDGAYERDPDRRRKHFYGMFLSVAQDQLRAQGVDLGKPANCRPQLFIPKTTRDAVRVKFEKYERPWTFINPRSESYNVRQVPDGVFAAAATKIKGTKFWIGMHPAPAGIIDLNARHLDNVIDWLSVADLLVSVDTGPLHIAAAINTPILALGQSSSPELHLGDQTDFFTLDTPLECRNCQQNVCRINHDVPPCQNFDPDLMADWANAKNRPTTHPSSVSAVVAIWKPEVNLLNQTLAALVDQVDEVVVTAEGNSIVPTGAMTHPKIRYVRTWKKNIGYSGNVNFGARNSTGAWLLLINDDCILDPEAVQKMKHEITGDVGIVCNLLRYPDGTIYFAGKVRSAGQRGWSHIDYRKKVPTFQGAIEIENACGCCILTPRKLFYDIGGMDEDMPIFAQDDAYSLCVRQRGYRIVFTPHSTGVHLEHQSISKLPESIGSLMASCNAAFSRKFGWYLEKNLHTVPGTF